MKRFSFLPCVLLVQLALSVGCSKSDDSQTDDTATETQADQATDFIDSSSHLNEDSQSNGGTDDSDSRSDTAPVEDTMVSTDSTTVKDTATSLGATTDSDTLNSPDTTAEFDSTTDADTVADSESTTDSEERGDSDSAVCGDGVVSGLELCDDGNMQNSDGCSSTCTVEDGFTCKQAVCEDDDWCTVELDAVYRDFDSSDGDFLPAPTCYRTGGVPEMVAQSIGANGKPVLTQVGIDDGCVASVDSFNNWYSKTPSKSAPLILFSTDGITYANRYGVKGQQWQFTDEEQLLPCGTPPSEIVDCTFVENADCQARCPDAVALYPDYICTSPCPDDYDNRTCLVSPDAPTCLDCPNLVAGVEGFECRKPCGGTGAGFAPWDVCEYGAPTSYFDGTPLFFPLDDVSFTSGNSAVISTGYGYPEGTEEPDIIPGNSPHNFRFTTEMVYWFRYELETVATLQLFTESEAWIFVNGQLAVDSGGLHPPIQQQVSIEASNAFGMTDGNVYPIHIFLAARQPNTSSLRLTMTGFNPTQSVCTLQN